MFCFFYEVARFVKRALGYAALRSQGGPLLLKRARIFLRFFLSLFYNNKTSQQ
jgi:hypothetical protein